MAAPPFLTSKELSSREGFLDFENEKYVVSYLLSGQGAASSLNCPARDNWNISPQGTNLQLLTLVRGTHLPPASILGRNCKSSYEEHRLQES